MFVLQTEHDHNVLPPLEVSLSNHERRVALRQAQRER
jgi:hypothetical protein